MADKKSPRTPLMLSPEALFRYQIVSAVMAWELSGQGTDAAVREVAAQHHLALKSLDYAAAAGHATVSVQHVIAARKDLWP